MPGWKRPQPLPRVANQRVVKAHDSKPETHEIPFPWQPELEPSVIASHTAMKAMLEAWKADPLMRE